MNMEIANRLTEYRKSNNLSQETLAGKMGISAWTVSEWERGEISPDTEQLIMLAQLYRVSVDDLLNVNEEIVPANDEAAKEEEQIELLLWLTAVAGYVALGCIYHIWHPGWLIFLLVPVISSAVTAFRTKRADRFAFPLLALAVFLYIGCVKMIWHPTWLLFLTIPVYYAAIRFFGGKKN